MDILELVKLINKELCIDGNFTRIAKDLFGKSESSLRKKLNKAGYKRIGNEYIPIGDDNMPKVRHTSPTPVDHFQEILDSKNSLTPEQYEGDMNLVLPNDINENILKLASNFNRIMTVVEQFENTYNSKYEDEYDNGIIIELPIETKKDFRATTRVNNVIWELFGNFCTENSMYTKRDLVSMALKEYMQKYSK